jgi:5-(carboxyamino)imidazole ribonucleotide synthase
MNIVKRDVIEPGKGNYIGILGGGQLGKMIAIAATKLGYRTMVWAPAGDTPAMDVASFRIEAPFNNQNAFEKMMAIASVVTIEWENIPVSLIEKFEARRMPVSPSSQVLRVSQSRNAEKQCALDVGAHPTPWIFIESLETLQLAEMYKQYLPGILKTDRFGYDGKGQYTVTSYEELMCALEQANAPCVLEKRIDIAYEVSMLVARKRYGGFGISPAVRNVHTNGILRSTEWYGSLIPEYIETNIQQKVLSIANELLLEGILVAEFFVTTKDEVFFNEMAPRPHNSFHGSIEAAKTSQFEQLVRAMCELPLGDMSFHSPFKMYNLLGNEWEKWPEMLMQGGSVHLYGKRETKEGRKMGHVTWVL